MSKTADAGALPGWAVALAPPVLVVRFGRVLEVASWAIVNGGRRRAEAVAWLEVRNSDLPPEVDPARLLADRLEAHGLTGAVGLLTSRRIDRFREARADLGGVVAQALATVGLSNAVAVGDEPGPLAVAGTINVLCALSAPLTEAAAREALSVAAEARTAAVLEAQVPSRRSRRLASGTGTDCLVLAWPAGPEPGVPYAGKHTAVGAAVGRAVREAVAAGVADWREEYRC